MASQTTKPWTYFAPWKILEAKSAKFYLQLHCHSLLSPAVLTDQSKRRREADKKAIETEYRAKVQAAQAKIEKIKEAHEAKV